jgi:hypothetical protein
MRRRPGIAVALGAGILVGAAATALAAHIIPDAGVAGWSRSAVGKDGSRLAASADGRDAVAFGTGCTELARDRQTGLTVAVACGSIVPALGSLRPGEIES